MSSWRGKRVLVTGADGFIGSHLTEALVMAGAEVRAFCVYNSQGSLGWLDHTDAAIRAGIEPRLGDIRDARFVEASCEGMEVVFHLAALIAIPYSYVAAESFVDTNVRGTLNVLDAVRGAKCARLVHTSTSEVYGSPDTLPIVEAHPLKAQSPYSATKIAADKLCEAYVCSFGVPVVTLRPFNTYGPRQSARALVPTLLAQMIAGRRQIRVGSTTPRRDLTYVGDTVRGFLAAGETDGIEGRVIQLGTGRAESVAEIFAAACAACEAPSVELVSERQRIRPDASEVTVLQSDPALAARLLGWRAEVSLEEGLRRTAAWIRMNPERFRPDEYSI